MNKNDIIPLEIVDVSADGSGIGKYNGMAVFVPLTAIGDKLNARVVKVKKNYAFAIIENLISPSADRITPDCPTFRQCGGCVYRHINYESECEIKKNKVEQAMRRIGGIDISPKPIISAISQDRYRNKAQYPVLPDGSVGFFALHSHRIVACEDCLLGDKDFSAAAKAFRDYMHDCNLTAYGEIEKKGLVRHFYLRKAYATGELMAVVVINGKSVPNPELLTKSLCKALGDSLKSIQLNINTDDTNVILGKENIVLFGNPYITDILCGVSVRLSPNSFYQVNREMAQLLYEKAAQYAQPEGKDVLDLYCGAGTIGLSMAKKAKNVIGVEIIPQAVNDAVCNAKENNIENARFICADAEYAAVKLNKEGIKPQVVIVDPPRKGCSEKLLHTIAYDFSPERLVYVSCDPATLARDTLYLTQNGYNLIEYTPVDLFPRTAHVESVALLVRTDSSI